MVPVSYRRIRPVTHDTKAKQGFIYLRVLALADTAKPVRAAPLLACLFDTGARARPACLLPLNWLCAILFMGPAPYVHGSWISRYLHGSGMVNAVGKFLRQVRAQSCLLASA